MKKVIFPIMLGAASLHTYSADLELHICETASTCMEANIKNQLIDRSPYNEQGYLVVDLVNNTTTEYQVIQAFGAEAEGSTIVRKIQQVPNSLHQDAVKYVNYLRDPVPQLLRLSIIDPSVENTPLPGHVSGKEVFLMDDFALYDVYAGNVKNRILSIATVMTSHLDTTYRSRKIDSNFIDKVNISLARGALSISAQLTPSSPFAYFYLPVPNSGVFVKIKAELRDGQIKAKVESLDIADNGVVQLALPVIDGEVSLAGLVGQSFQSANPASLQTFFQAIGMTTNIRRINTKVYVVDILSVDAP
uniref:Uncharacterized protein n=1 Tax=Rheinheimera sp. BAL341 TaxID=1708203 RepID=A0A486XPB9_9GAMM